MAFKTLWPPVCQHVPAQSLDTGVILAQPWFSEEHPANVVRRWRLCLDQWSKPASSNTRIESLFIITNIVRRAHSSRGTITLYADTIQTVLLFDILIRTINSIKIKAVEREWATLSVCVCVCNERVCLKANHRNLVILALCSQTDQS